MLLGSRRFLYYKFFLVIIFLNFFNINLLIIFYNFIVLWFIISCIYIKILFFNIFILLQCIISNTYILYIFWTNSNLLLKTRCSFFILPLFILWYRSRGSLIFLIYLGQIKLRFIAETSIKLIIIAKWTFYNFIGKLLIIWIEFS